MDDVIRWGVCDRAFDLATADQELRDYARVVFGPWPASKRAQSARRWEARREREGFSLANGGAQPPAHYASAHELVQAVEYAAIATIAQAPGSRLAFHGALVARADAGILILGAPASGKSTLALALWQRGWTLRGDDTTLVDGDSTAAWPCPRRVSVRHGSRPLLGDALWRNIEASPSACATGKGLIFHPEEVEPRPRLAPSSRLGGIVILGRAEASAPLTRVVPAHALLVLPVYTLQSLELGLGPSLERIRTLAETAPAYTLGRAPLGALVDQIEALFA